ncbi:unnamed protein product, partial [Ilex paraguariensis]
HVKKRSMKTKWSDSIRESTFDEDSSSLEDEEKFTAFIGSHSYPLRETSRSVVEEEGLSSAIEVDDLVVEVTSRKDDMGSVEDLQDAFDQLDPSYGLSGFQHPDLWAC